MFNIKYFNSGAEVLSIRQSRGGNGNLQFSHSLIHSFTHWANMNQVFKMPGSILTLTLIDDQSRYTLNGNTVKVLFPL